METLAAERDLKKDTGCYKSCKANTSMCIFRRRQNILSSVLNVVNLRVWVLLYWFSQSIVDVKCKLTKCRNTDPLYPHDTQREILQ